MVTEGLDNSRCGVFTPTTFGPRFGLVCESLSAKKTEI